MKSCCGVLEFTAEEGVCFIPDWMMRILCVEEGADVTLQSINYLQKGTYMKFIPHELAFVKLPNPKAM